MMQTKKAETPFFLLLLSEVHMSINKLICILLAAAMLLALAACGSKTAEDSDSTSSAVQEATAAPETAAEATSAPTEAAAAESTAAVNAVPGTLYPLNLKDDEEPVVTALQLSGNRAGTAEGINGKEPSTENIRSVFELNEWIVIYPETSQTGLSAFVVAHSDDPASYTDAFIAALSDETPKAELVKPEEAGECWGSLYVNPDDWKAGDYDLLFISGVKPVAYVMIKLYNEGELSEKTDAELEALMTADNT